MFGRLGNRTSGDVPRYPASADQGTTDHLAWAWPSIDLDPTADSDATAPIPLPIPLPSQAPIPAPRHTTHAAAPTRPTRRWKTAIGLTALTVAAGSLGGLVTEVVAGHPESTPAPLVRSSEFAPSTMNVANVVTAISPAVVAVHAQSDTERSAGTGIVVTATGQIVTNAHVVDGARSVTVTPTGTTTSRPARVVDVSTAADIAVLQVADWTGLRAAPLAAADQIRVGDDVIAIGNALNLGGDPSVTRGIVSGVNRTMISTGESLTGMLQTDAPVSAGDSGGPLVNAAGQVIGVDTAVATASDGNTVQNVNFAIPVGRLLTVLHSFGVYPPGS